MEWLRPGFLAAGAALALLPLLLHLLVPRTRERRTLPTARFLTPEPRSRLRLRRRPTDLPLLLLRMGFALVLGAAFAGGAWHGLPSPGTEVLLAVDGGERGGAAWEAIREAARERWRPGYRVIRVDGWEADGSPRWAAASPDSEAALLTFLDEGEGVVPASLPLLLRALRAEAVAGNADSARAVVVSLARVGSWPPGTASARERLWPGAVEWVPGRDPVTPAVQVEVEAPSEVAPTLEAALSAAGWWVLPREGAGAGPAGDAPGLRVRLEVGPLRGDEALWRAEGGGGGAPEGVEESGPSPGVDGFVLADGRRYPAWGPPPPGIPAPGTTVPLHRSGGWPAAAALEEGGGDTGDPPLCRIRIPVDPEPPPGGLEGAFGGPDLPDLLDGILLRACPRADPVPLALAQAVEGLLAGGGGGEAVAVQSLRGPGDGRPLTPLFLAVAFLLLAGEMAWIRRRRREREAGT